MADVEELAATRAVYDATAVAYAEAVGTEVTAAFESVIDRAFLTAFAERVGTGVVADVGCGPGRVASLLAARGIEVVGVDLSPAMVDVARASHPTIRFEEGRLDHLPFEAGSLAGAVCWYSIIHTAPVRLGEVFSELERVVAPGGHLLLGFQAGDGSGVARSDAYGSGRTLTSYRHDVADVDSRLRRASFSLHASAERNAELPHETTPQAFILSARATTGAAD